MASNIVLVAMIAIAGASLVNAADCDCKDYGDTKELWDFFKKISNREILNNEEEEDMNSVLPGMLSPLMDCDCENSRRKRAISAEDTTVQPDAEVTKLEKLRSLRQRKSIRFGTRHCPSGFAKVGYLCVQEEFLEE